MATELFSLFKKEYLGRPRRTRVLLGSPKSWVAVLHWVVMLMAYGATLQMSAGDTSTSDPCVHACSDGQVMSKSADLSGLS